MNPTIKDLYEQNEKILEKIERKYVQKIEFLPIKLLVYGATAIILTRVVGTGVGYIVSNYSFTSLVLAVGK